MFNFEKISTTRFYTAPTIERVVEFSPPDVDTSNVAKILSLAVDAKCVACESGAGYAQINGRTNFRLVYLDKDGTVRGVDYNADFTLRADGDNAKVDFSYKFTANVKSFILRPLDLSMLIVGLTIAVGGVVAISIIIHKKRAK